MRLKFTRRDRGNFSGGLLLVLPVCCRDRTERVLAVRATGVMVNGSVLREDSTGFVVGGDVSEWQVCSLETVSGARNFSRAMNTGLNPNLPGPENHVRTRLSAFLMPFKDGKQGWCQKRAQKKTPWSRGAKRLCGDYLLLCERHMNIT